MPSTIDPSVPVFGNPTTLSVRQNFQRAYNEITGLQDSIGTLPIRVSTAESSIVALQSSVGTLQNDVADLKAAGPGSGNGTISALTTRVTNAESAIGLLQTRMSTAESNIAALGDLSALTTRIGTAEGNITSLTTRIGTAEGKIAALETAGPGPGGGLPTTGGALSGALTINTAGAAASPVQAGTVLQMVSPTSTTVALDSLGTVPSFLQLRRAGGAPGSPTALGGSAQMGILQWQGWRPDNQWGGGGNIHCATTAAWTGAGQLPTRMNFQVTRATASNPTTAMYIGDRGGLIIGASGVDYGDGAVTAQNIYVGGNLEVNGEIMIQGTSLSDYIAALIGP